jgi:hypothetical protein
VLGPGSFHEPASHTVRDLGVLAVVVALLAALVVGGSRVEYAVPVSLGNATIKNVDEVVADAEDRFQQYVDAQADRVAEDASCYFFRPLGPTQGAVPAGMFPPGLLPGGEDAEAIDILLCGPVEMSNEAMDAIPGSEPEPWLTGIVYYFSTDGGTALRGEFQTMLQSSLALLASVEQVTDDYLIAADGHKPDADDIENPEWKDVTPTGDAIPIGPDLPGGDLPPDVTLPPGVELPPGVTLPPGLSLPEPPPGVTLPGEGD